jgi:hypothetical protein
VKSSPDSLLVFAEQALDRVLAAKEGTRGVAFDLLAADAFVTYAFESAADEPSTVSARADDAMRRISKQAEPFLS